MAGTEKLDGWLDSVQINATHQFNATLFADDLPASVTPTYKKHSVNVWLSAISAPVAASPSQT